MKILIILFNMFLFLIGACGESISNDEVEKLGNQFFTSMQNKEFEKIMDYYDADFFKSHASEQWLLELNTLDAELGDIVNFKLQNIQADTRFSGKFFIHQYYVEHVRGPVWHTLTFQNPTNSKDLKFIGHKIQKKGNN